jgi:hypothetical protein
MSKEATKKRDVRDSKQIIEKLSYEEFKIVCDGLNVVEDSIKQLWAIATSTDDDKVKTDIFKWLIEMNVGKAKQSADITSKGESVSAGIFIDTNILE